MKKSPFPRTWPVLLTLLGVFSASAPIWAQTPPPLPAQFSALRPTNILPADWTTSTKFEDRSQTAQKAVLTRVTSPGAPPRVRIESFARTGNASSVEAALLTGQAMKRGDIGLIRFSIRALSAAQESGEAVYTCYLQQSALPFEKSLTVQLGAGPDWRTYEIPFEAKLDHAAGQTGLFFGLGLIPQTVEISGAQILNFEKRATVETLPATRFTYAGREAGAAWRTKALQRIQELRTAPIVISVRDSNNNIVAGARVQARLVRPAFAFGSAVTPSMINGDSPDSQIYREKVLELFDTVAIDNDMKWQQFLSTQRREGVFRALDWFADNNLRLRGHTLVWPGMKFSPRRLGTLANPGVEIPQQIETHIEDIMTATKGRVWAWDVLNEPVHEQDFYKFFPAKVSAEWFKQARRADPSALLFINEYAMLNSRTSPDFIRRYLEFTKMLQDNGAPIDGMGVQGHIGSQPRNPTDVLSDLDLLQTGGLPIQITEFDINTRDEELQADYTRDFLIAVYSHPGVSAFVQWGFWQGAHWKPDAAMFRRDWSAKTSLKAYTDLVSDQWRTKIDATTSAAGRVEARGHLGVYEITVTSGAQKLSHVLNLTKERGEVRLTMQVPLPPAALAPAALAPAALAPAALP